MKCTSLNRTENLGEVQKYSFSLKVVNPPADKKTETPVWIGPAQAAVLAADAAASDSPAADSVDVDWLVAKLKSQGLVIVPGSTDEPDNLDPETGSSAFVDSLAEMQEEMQTQEFESPDTDSGETAAE